jgi:energy-coupling factor transporter transmembrane protein EcfT
MRTPWHEIGGSGRGPAARIAPQGRILAGALLFAACLVAPARTGPGVALIAAVAAAWMGACGTPWRTVRSFALLGLAMFLPFLLLAPYQALANLRGLAGPERWARALAAPWDVFYHGLAGLFIAAATMTVLSASDLRRGVLALPLPRAVAAILIQIVHQTSALLAETGRVAAAVAVRAGSGPFAWKALASLPRVWLPRIVARADRVAAAMDVRGYAETDLRLLGRTPLRLADGAAIAAACGVLALAAGLRWGVVA